MTTSIKVVNTEEAKKRIKELFGNLHLKDIAVIHEINETNSNIAINSKTSITTSNIASFRKKIEDLGGSIKDISIVGQKKSNEFSISSITRSEFQVILESYGIDPKDVVVVNSKDLDSKPNNNPIKNTKRF